MQYPVLASHPNTASYLAALKDFENLNTEIMDRLQSLIVQADPSTTIPDWVAQARELRHVWCDNLPDGAERTARVHALAANMLLNNLRPRRVCHGVMEWQGETGWWCIVECEDGSTEKAAA